MTTSSGSEIYAEFIEAELKAENDRRDSVHTRAGAAVTSSTGLITLVLGVFGFLVGKNLGFPNSAKPFLVVAVVSLLATGALAVAAGFPVGQKFVTDSTLDRMLASHRSDSEEVARDAVAYIKRRGPSVTQVWDDHQSAPAVRVRDLSNLCHGGYRRLHMDGHEIAKRSKRVNSTLRSHGEGAIFQATSSDSITRHNNSNLVTKSPGYAVAAA